MSKNVLQFCPKSACKKHINTGFYYVLSCRDLRNYTWYYIPIIKKHPVLERLCDANAFSQGVGFQNFLCTVIGIKSTFERFGSRGATNCT
jgi:hypothetical protein